MEHEEKTGCFMFGDRKWSEYVLDTSSTGLWSMTTDREMRETRMYVDRTMAKLLGLPGNLTPEDCFEFWYKRKGPGDGERPVPRLRIPPEHGQSGPDEAVVLKHGLAGDF